MSLLDESYRPDDKLEQNSISSSSDDSDSPDESFGLSSGETELMQTARGITSMVGNLFKMSMIIRKGNISEDRLLRSSKIDVSFFERYDIEHAKHKIPMAGEALWVRFGKAISSRRQYLEYRKQHHMKLSQPLVNDDAVKISVQRKSLRSEKPSQAASNAQSPQEYASEAPLSEKQSSSRLASTQASQFVPAKIGSIVDLDVDVLSESGTVTSYQSSAAGSEILRLPPPPQVSDTGREFECPYCFTICKLGGSEPWQRKREWK